MHEIGVLTETVKAVEKLCEENNISDVKFITLEIGELCGYVPLFFEKYFPIVTEGKSVFVGTELRIRTVRGQALCTSCESLYNVMKNEGRCPQCGSRDKKIIGGQEFVLKEIGY